jgi:23S rRNA (uracil1939-C5)-methyltransferase
MSNRKPQKTVDVHVTAFNKKGYGLGISEDETQRKVQVPFTMPGDKVRAALQSKRSGVFLSRLEEIMTPAELRVQPRCIHFGQCGGCRWQHIPYTEQLRLKQEAVEKLLQPLLPSNIEVNPIVACDSPWHYRNKMEFSFSRDAADNQYLGLIIDGSRGKVFNLTECHHVNSWFADVLAAVRLWWSKSGTTAYHPYTNTGSLRTLTVREGKRSGDRLVMLTVSGNADYALSRQQVDSFTACVRDSITPVDGSSRLSIFLRIHQAIKGTPTNFYEMLLHGSDHIREVLNIQPDIEKEISPLTFTVGPSAFFQPNTQQAEDLYSLALQKLHIPVDSVVYDLYCGTGTLGICAAKHARQVLGIEISPEAALDARTNAAANGLENINILTGAVRDVVAKVRKEQSFPPPDVVMVDPPRSGLDSDTIRHLGELRPSKILYISCNPATQAENIKDLQAFGYRVETVQPVDQFPHTVHIENIVVLVLSIANSQS